ncbi:hypothetical protein L1049_014051 [Liquidambar formosana]|uniref:Uncharacterized protein n=1 Tax=Liquidambar formosana TaxID=63359 RepID=A0AAP0RLF9_LIQFO
MGSVKFPTLPIQLPFFVSCPWCNLVCFRLVYKGNPEFPRKNFFLPWMVESMNGDRSKLHSSSYRDQSDHQPMFSSTENLAMRNQVSPINHRRSPHVRPSEQIRVQS